MLVARIVANAVRVTLWVRVAADIRGEDFCYPDL